MDIADADDDGTLTLGTPSFNDARDIVRVEITGGTVDAEYCLECEAVTTNNYTLGVLGKLKIIGQCQ